MEYSFNQIVNSKNTKCKLHKIYKNIIETTNFLGESISFKIRWWYFQNNIKESVKCLCGCGLPLKNPIKTKYLQGHSNRSDEVKANKEKSVMKNYGVANISQIEDVKAKKKETMLKNHGCETPFDRDFIVPIWIEKYGVDNPSKLQNVKDKISEHAIKYQKENLEQRTQSFLNNFFDGKIMSDRLSNVKPLFTKEQYKGVNVVYPFECLTCGNTIHSNLDDGKDVRCFNCNPNPSKSILESEILTFCKKFYPNLVENDRQIIQPLELDIYIPDIKTAIEVNGIYWHTEQYGKNKTYHLNKTEKCSDKDVRIIHIFEDELVEKPEICKARLKHIFGKIHRNVYARKCVIEPISPKLKGKFLAKYHIQGNDKCKISLGLFYKSRLVSVMTFSSLRSSLGYKETKENVWELSRYCSIFNFNVVGGAGKLLKHFENTYNPKTVISYADRRWSNGNLYSKIGFIFDKFTEPNYWYVKNDRRYHRFNFQKHLLSEKLSNFDSNLSEKDNMNNNGYHRIWDCGHCKFIKNYY